MSREYRQISKYEKEILEFKRYKNVRKFVAKPMVIAEFIYGYKGKKYCIINN